MSAEPTTGALPGIHHSIRSGAMPAGLLARTPWLRVSASLFAVAWGGNEFTPLLVMYRDLDHLGTATVDVLLGAYVLGIVPALLLGGPLSDRFGRRPLMLPAPFLGLVGSAILAAGAGSAPLLFVGRVFSGIALGLVMAVGTAWMKELSSAPFDRQADAATGARRAALSLTVGFGLGAGAAAAIAQFGPWPATMPYLVNIALTAIAAALLLGSPETRRRQQSPGRLIDDLRVPAAMHRRFLFVVAPMAPWVFGTAASAYAILPGLMRSRVPGLEVGFSGLLCLIALGCGVGVQTLARRFDDAGSARAVAVALAVTVPGMALAALTALTRSLPLAFLTAAVLGAAYGLLIVSGLQEIQRIAGPDDLAGLTAVYYSLTYLGFFIPAILAFISPVVGYPAMFAVGAIIAIGCLVVVACNWRRHLPEASVN